MDRILIILKKENGPRASSAPALGLNTIIFKYVYWYMKQISGERLQDHWSSGYCFSLYNFLTLFNSADLQITLKLHFNNHHGGLGFQYLTSIVMWNSETSR